jgi:hypothetical protein
MQGSMGAQRAPEADEGLEQAVRPPLELVVARDDGDDLGGGEGTTRRAMVTKGVLLIAGAFGAGIAATKLSDGGEPKQAAAPATGRSTIELTSSNVRWHDAASEPGKLPAPNAVKTPHGTLYDSKGREVGDFSTSVMTGSGAPIAMQRLEFSDGTIFGVGSGGLDDVYAIVGGNGRFDGVGGSYVLRQNGKIAEFKLRLTQIAG